MARERDSKGRFKPLKHKGGEGAEPKGSAIEAGRAKRAASPWTKEKTAIFFRELSILCNVSEALRRAQLTKQSSTVYDRRRTDAAFRARWDEAIVESYALLELEMLERTRFGDDRPEPRTEVEKRLRQVSTAQAMQLLKLYHARVKANGGAAPAQPRQARRISRQRAREIRANLDRMLSEFNRAMGGEG